MPRRKKDAPAAPNRDRLPRHIALYMDGNGRWAKKRGLPRSAGHAAGAERFRSIATYCNDIGIEYLTVFAFSTENWRRPEDEVRGIMSLLRRYMLESIASMERDNIRLRIAGDHSRWPEGFGELKARTDEISSRTTGMLVTVCLNYGGRDDIAHAARLLAEECAAGRLAPGEIDETLLASRMYTAGLPDPDLVIRSSGEKRISNFLLWQSAYSEYYFTDALWPDFTSAELERALAEYAGRSRRFGGV